jgi:hypothetical protein
MQVNVIEPHPNAAVIGTSGLDHDVKVWMPTDDGKSAERNDRERRELTRRNLHERAHERRHPDNDADLIYYMLRQIVARVSAACPNAHEHICFR